MVYSMFISNRFSVNIVERVVGIYIERVFIRHSGWLTGGCGLHKLRKCVVFHQSEVFYHCLWYLLTDIRKSYDLVGYYM